MIDSNTLMAAVTRYRSDCIKSGRSPTFKGLATLLEISEKTVSRVFHGSYAKDKCYTGKEHCSRLVANDDFETVQALYSEVK